MSVSRSGTGWGLITRRTGNVATSTRCPVTLRRMLESAVLPRTQPMRLSPSQYTSAKSGTCWLSSLHLFLCEERFVWAKQVVLACPVIEPLAEATGTFSQVSSIR